MSSETAWVWVYLPGDVAPTLCGQFVHHKTPGGAVGQFVYGKSYLQNRDAQPLDPIQLRLSAGTYETTALNGVFGPLHDAMPDDWGCHVINRMHGVQDSPVGFLLLARDDRIGHLAFSKSQYEPPTMDKFGGTEVLEAARDVLRGMELGRPLDPEVAQWVQPNTGVGGARPKLTIQHDDALWMAKFPARNDYALLPVAQLEAAMLDLARMCKITTVEAQVVNGDILLVKRFDRALVAREADGTARWRRDAFLSARSIFYAEPSVQATAETGSYPRLAIEMARCSEAVAVDRAQLYRRMVFNCCVSNTDDHDRNHGILAGDTPGQYRLAPAFDIVPRVHQTRRRYQALGVGDEGAIATKTNVLSSCASFGLSRTDAALVLDEVETTVRENWERCLVAQGASDEAIATYARCFQLLPASAGQALPRERGPKPGADFELGSLG